MPNKNAAEHVTEQMQQGQTPDVLDEHVKALAKDAQERKALKEAVQSAAKDKRETLANDIEGHKKALDANLSGAEETALETLAAELKQDVVPVGSGSFLDTSMTKINEYSTMAMEFIQPYLDAAQDFFAGSAGTLWTMMGFQIPSWARPEAVEIRGIKAIFREPAFKAKGLTLENNPDVNEDRKKMRELKDIFLKTHKSNGLKNMPEFLRNVVQEAQTINDGKISLTMEDLVDAAKTKYPIDEAPKPEKKEEEKKA